MGVGASACSELADSGIRQDSVAYSSEACETAAASAGEASAAAAAAAGAENVAEVANVGGWTAVVATLVVAVAWFVGLDDGIAADAAEVAWSAA